MPTFRAIAVALISAAALTSCAGDRLLHLTVPEGFAAGTELLFLIDRAGGTELYARDLAVEPYVLPRYFSEDAELDLEAWLIAAPLEALGLTSGPQALAADASSGSALFVPTLRRRAELVAGVFSAWTPLDGPSSHTETLRLAGDSYDCLAAGGCFEGDYCRLPCTPQPPDDPAPPKEPALDGCPPGWADTPPPYSCAPWTTHCPIDLLDRTGSACSTPFEPCENFPPNAPAGALYVDDSAPPGGTGSSSAPLARISEALLLLGPPPATVALAPGDYPEDLALPDGLRILGACPAATKLLGALTITAGRVELAGLTLEGGATIRTATLTVDRVFLRNTGLAATDQALLRITGAAFEEAGLEAVGAGTHLAVERGTMTGALASVKISAGARATLRKVWFTDAGAVAVVDRGSDAQITDAVWSGGELAFKAAAGSSGSLVRALMAGTNGGVRSSGAVIAVTDLDLRHPEGFGLRLDAPAYAENRGARGRITAERARVAGAIGASIQIETADFTGTDLELTDSRPELHEDGARRYEIYGRGLNVQDNAEATVTRMISRNHNVHAFRSSGSRFTLNDVRLEGSIRGYLGSAGCPAGDVADGASIYCASMGTIRRFVISNNECGISADGGFILEEGLLTGNGTGLCISGEPPAPAQLQHVKFEGRAIGGPGGS